MNENGSRYLEMCSAIALALLVVLVPLVNAEQGLPSGWTVSNIAFPTLPGSAVYSNGVFSVTGAGAGLSGLTDQFTFAYRQFTGDGAIVALVSGLSSANTTSSAGIMIRESLQAASKNASVLVTPGGVSVRWRSTFNTNTVSVSGGSGTAPVWLKLERQGSTFRASRSPNGSTWTSIGSTTISMSSTTYVGLAVSSTLTSKLALATFSGVTIGASGTSPGTGSNQAPSVSLSAPTSGSAYVAPATINIAATAADSDGSIARVDFYAGSAFVGSDTSSPYSATWSNVAAGTYSLTAIARDNLGAATTSAARTVTVSSSTSSNKPPTVSITSPLANTALVAPATIGIAATASDSDGSVSRVDFYNGSTLIGSDTTSPYAVTWSNVATGTYSVTAVARDNVGAMTVSSALTLLVVNPTMPKRVLFTPSANYATAVNSNLLEIFQAGSNPATASPIATQNLGKPAVVNGQCNVDIAQTIFNLPTGTYIATVTAIGNGGSTQSAASPPFNR